MSHEQSVTQEESEARRVEDQSRQAPDLTRPNACLVGEKPVPRLAPLERLELMSAPERLRAYRVGALTRAERSAWAGAYPEEVPLVNDELEWIALSAE